MSARGPEETGRVLSLRVHPPQCHLSKKAVSGGSTILQQGLSGQLPSGRRISPLGGRTGGPKGTPPLPNTHGSPRHRPPEHGTGAVPQGALSGRCPPGHPPAKCREDWVPSLGAPSSGARGGPSPRPEPRPLEAPRHRPRRR